LKEPVDSRFCVQNCGIVDGHFLEDEGGTVVPVFADFVDGASQKVAYGERAADWFGGRGYRTRLG